MEERNKNYAADSARLMAVQINDDLNNALNLIDTYSYFVGQSLSEPMVTAQMLKEMEKNSLFDALMFTDLEGVDYCSDGRTADVTDRVFYQDGIKGGRDFYVIFEPHFLMKLWYVFTAQFTIKKKL